MAFDLPRLRIVTIFFVGSCVTMSGSVLAPVLVSIAEQFKGTPHVDFLARIMLVAHNVSAILFTPLLGWLCDRVGRRFVLLFSTVVYVVGGTSGAYLESLWGIIIGRLVMGIGMGGAITTAYILISDYYDEPLRSRYVGYMSVTLSFAGILFVFLASLTIRISWRAPFYCYGYMLASIPAVLLTIGGPGQTVKLQGPLGSPTQVGSGSSSPILSRQSSATADQRLVVGVVPTESDTAVPADQGENRPISPLSDEGITESEKEVLLPSVVSYGAMEGQHPNAGGLPSSPHARAQRQPNVAINTTAAGDAVFYQDDDDFPAFVDVSDAGVDKFTLAAGSYLSGFATARAHFRGLTRSQSVRFQHAISTSKSASQPGSTGKMVMLVATIYLCSFLIQTSFYQIPTFSSFLLEKIEHVESNFKASMVIAVCVISSLPLSYYFQKIHRYLNHEAAALFSFTSMACGFFVAYCSPTLLVVSLGVALVGAGFGLGWPNFNSWMISICTTTQWSTMLISGMSGFQLLGILLSPFIAEPIIDSYPAESVSGIMHVFLYASVVLASFAVFFLLWVGRNAAKYDEPDVDQGQTNAGKIESDPLLV